MKKIARKEIERKVSLIKTLCESLGFEIMEQKIGSSYKNDSMKVEMCLDHHMFTEKELTALEYEDAKDNNDEAGKTEIMARVLGSNAVK